MWSSYLSLSTTGQCFVFSGPCGKKTQIARLGQNSTEFSRLSTVLYYRNWTYLVYTMSYSHTIYTDSLYNIYINTPEHNLVGS